ncbi:hypothetical protein HOLleu_15048 [Holothuria leucospilota]|uniref:G-protein coupled receptors family 1 profile domain-containing protein n=1 Tax=Holothuria leucospilota TaxID=206669 RepID=A0A9Q1C9M5_HOLLE|nr:hypothetical protein HOLleu_15048 [Holothuria leucospilota]
MMSFIAYAVIICCVGFTTDTFINGFLYDDYNQFCCYMNTAVCLNNSVICDGIQNCPDGEDEIFCANYIFDPDDYCCSDNISKCISSSMECDGHYDCPGGDDEFFCDVPQTPECLSKGMLYCAEDPTVCLEHHDICDGRFNCPYNSDEFHCHDTCPANCSVCSRLELVCESYYPWTYEEVSDVKEQVPNVKSVVLVGPPKLNDVELTWSEAIGNDTSYFLRHVTSGIFQSLNIKYISPFDFLHFEDLLVLGIVANKLTFLRNGTFSSLELLKELHLQFNQIEEIEGGALPANVELLSLLGNNLKVLRKGMFEGMIRLQHLNIKSNEIAYIEDDTFQDLGNLTNLDLENNRITSLNAPAFAGLVSLEYIHLTFNKLTFLENTVFRFVPKLSYIDLSGNPLQDIEGGTFAVLYHLRSLLIQSTELNFHDKSIADGLQNLEILVADNFGMCCLVNEDTDCQTPPSPFATCRGIFRTPLLRASAWIVSLCALGGNLLVVVMRIKRQRRFSSANPTNIQNHFITNLAIADLLTGLYLFTLAIADAHFGSDYFLHSKDWREGSICKTIGVIGVLSSMVSIQILTVITIDRFLCLVFPFGKVHFHSKSSKVTIFAVWTLGTLLAAIPALLSRKLDGFYGYSDVCLGLPLVTDAKELTSQWVLGEDLAGYEFVFIESEERTGWVYSQVLFIYFSAVCVVIITVCYVLMFFTVKKSARLSQRSETSSQEVTMAIKMAFIVGTDMLCWVPIIILGILSQCGIEIPVAFYAWIVIFVLPINSALNPFIFTFSSLRRRKRSSSTVSSGHQISRHIPQVPQRTWLPLTLLRRALQSNDRYAGANSQVTSIDNTHM